MTQLKIPNLAMGQYEADGFLICQDPIVPTEIVQNASQGMDTLRSGQYETGIAPEPSYWEPGDDADKFCKIEMPQIANYAIMDLITYPSIGEAVAQITGAKMVQVWWVQLLGKPPATNRGQTNVGWHQDQYYWRIWEEASQLLTVWVAISNVTEQDGPMRLVKGSHRWGLLEQNDFYGQDHDRQMAETKLPENEIWEEEIALLPAGGASFHHCLAYHASGPNRSSTMRRSLAIHARTEKSRPVNDQRTGLSRFIDNHDYCPIIYQSGLLV